VQVRAVLVVLAAALAILAASADASACTGARAVPTRATVDRARTATLCLVNAERRRRGKRALRTNGELQRSASAYARTMVRGGFFAHVTPSGLTLRQRIRRDGDYIDRAWRWRVGENIGWGAGPGATPAGIVAAWLASPEHRRTLLDGDFRDMGVGIAPGAPVDAELSVPAATYVNHFGQRD
jgi:uncharacterized protein YkwD